MQNLKEMKDSNHRSQLEGNFPSVFSLAYHKPTFAKWNGFFDAAKDNDVVCRIVEKFEDMGEVEAKNFHYPHQEWC